MVNKYSVNKLIEHTLSINGLGINRFTNKEFATVGFDKIINVYDSNAFRNIGILSGHEKGVWCCQYSHIDNLLISGSSDNNILFWDTKTNKPTNKLIFHSDAIYDIKFSNSGKQIVSCSKGQVAIWDIFNTKQPISVVKGTFTIIFKKIRKENLSTQLIS